MSLIYLSIAFYYTLVSSHLDSNIKKTKLLLLSTIPPSQTINWSITRNWPFSVCVALNYYMVKWKFICLANYRVSSATKWPSISIKIVVIRIWMKLKLFILVHRLQMKSYSEAFWSSSPSHIFIIPRKPVSFHFSS